MSLNIDTDYVTAVLLADGWHDVADQSFDIDAYEFSYNDRTVLGGGRADGVCATGFSFKAQGGESVSGPLTAVLAVRHTYPPS